MKQKEKNVAKILEKNGANTNHKCVSSIPSEGKTFLGMGKKGWLTTGAVVVAGGVAAAAGGGGGGGGSGYSYNTNTPSAPSVPNCVNGSLVNDKCVCNEGWKGNTCEQIVTCPYNTISCSNGYKETGNTCKSGSKIYVECKVNTCTGYEYTTCPIGYAQSDICQSGEIAKIKCDNCDTGYEKDINGNCVLIKEDIVGSSTTLDNGKIINNNEIKIVNDKYADIYGLKGNYVGNAYTSETVLPGSITEANAVIDIKNTNEGNIYGVYGNLSSNASSSSWGIAKGIINIHNIGNGDIYGLYAKENYACNACHSTPNKEYTEGIININNVGNGNIYGITGKYSTYNAYAPNYETGLLIADARASVIINNIGNGNVYGIMGIGVNSHVYNIYGDSTEPRYEKKAKGIVYIKNEGQGNVYGLYAKDGEVSNGRLGGYGQGEARVDIINTGGNSFGIYGNKVYNYTNITNKDYEATYYGYTTIANLGAGYAVGMYGVSEAYNRGDVIVHNLGSGTAVGVYVNGGTAGNSGSITITRASYKDKKATDTTADDKIYTATTSKGGTAVGIYGTSGAKITNSGTITIDGAENAYGIYAESGATITNSGKIFIENTNTSYGIYAEEDSTVTNTGEISIDGNKNHANAIKLNGAKLFQNGIMTAQSLNLSALGGEVVATSTSSFVAKDDISGNLSISNNVVRNGFDTTYTIKDMINAADTSNLNLVSKSAMFDADLKNGKDAVMTMKSFNDVLENKSLANFLQKNYALQNNEGLFGSIKSAESIKSLNNFADEMFGKDMFSRFAFEDLMIMRELNFDINNKLFNNKEDSLSIGGNKSSFAFSGNSRYSLTSVKNDKTSMGISVAFSDINSDDGNNKNQRYDRMYNISMPVGFQANGLKFVSTPRVGYSYGTYDRNGFDNQTYEGTVEKQMFAFMNEARYPIQVGGWNISPSAELNFINYRISGHEKDKEYSLKIKSQNNYSVEAGIGLYASKETKFSKDSSLRFNGGVALYHEFADPYKMKLGMSGMAGTFTLRDEDRSDNRAVVQSEIEFKHKNFSIVGNVASYIDRKYETNATLDFNFEF